MLFRAATLSVLLCLPGCAGVLVSPWSEPESREPVDVAPVLASETEKNAAPKPNRTSPVVTAPRTVESHREMRPAEKVASPEARPVRASSSPVEPQDEDLNLERGQAILIELPAPVYTKE